MSRPWLRATAWMLALIAVGVVLHLAAVGDLGAPPVTSPGDLGEWIDDRSSAAAAIALVRFGAELAAWYLVGLSALHGIGEAAGARSGHRLVDVLAVPGASRLVRAGLGLGLVAASAVGGRPTPAATPVMLAELPDTDERTGTASMRPIRDDVTAGDDTGGTAWMRPSVVLSEPAPTAPSGVPTTWSVTEGESLWSIAEDVMTARLGREATDTEIDPYWRRLVEVNRYRLVDPDDADLIVPGQVLEVPVPDAR